MQKNLINLLLSLLLVGSLSATTVTGTTKDPTTGNLFNGTISFTLAYNGARQISTQQILITPRPTIQYPVNNGQFGSISVVGNDDILPTKTVTIVAWYDPSGALVRSSPYYISGTTFDLGSAVPTPITTSNVSFQDLIGFRSITAQNIANVRFADLFTGSDIGAKANFAYSTCGNACLVRVPAGNYSYSTTIRPPDVNGGNVALQLDPGAYLTYTGSGDAILVSPANAGVINSNSIRISGGQLIGTSAAASGIHLQATARNTISDIDITGFSTGAGIICEGCINNSFISVQSRVNRIGYKEQSVSLFGNTYTNNANTWIGGHIQANTLFGVAHYVPPSIGSGGVANNFFGVTIEGNGGFTTQNVTAIADNATCALAGMCLNANTVTVTTTGAHGFVPGQLVDQTAAGACFSGRYTVVVVPTATTYTYICISANAHTGAGTIKGYSGNVFLEGGSNESFLGGYMEPAVNDGTVKATVYLGNSNFSPTNVNIRNVDFQSLGVVNTIDNFGGGANVDGNREGATNTNFFNQETAGGIINIGYNNVLSTNYLVGSTPPNGSIVTDPILKRITYYGGQFNSTVATGTPPILVSSATPVTTMVVANHPQISSCDGVATTCPAFSPLQGGKIVVGSSTFSAGVVTILNLPFSNTTYNCVGTDGSGLNVVKVTSKNSGSSVTFGGTGTDNFSFFCGGN